MKHPMRAEQTSLGTMLVKEAWGYALVIGIPLAGIALLMQLMSNGASRGFVHD